MAECKYCFNKRRPGWNVCHECFEHPFRPAERRLFEIDSESIDGCDDDQFDSPGDTDTLPAARQPRLT